MLRISIQESENTIGFTLVGRLAGPWVAELNRAWKETAGRMEGKAFSLDLRDLTYSDDEGKQALKHIFHSTGAKLVTSSIWSQHLAEEIKENGNHLIGRS